MSTGKADTEWLCATCRLPVTVKNSRYSGNSTKTFPVMVVVKECDCQYDGIINPKRGRFLSPEAP